MMSVGTESWKKMQRVVWKTTELGLQPNMGENLRREAKVIEISYVGD